MTLLSVHFFLRRAPTGRHAPVQGAVRGKTRNRIQDVPVYGRRQNEESAQSGEEGMYICMCMAAVLLAVYSSAHEHVNFVRQEEHFNRRISRLPQFCLVCPSLISQPQTAE